MTTSAEASTSFDSGVSVLNDSFVSGDTGPAMSGIESISSDSEAPSEAIAVGGAVEVKVLDSQVADSVAFYIGEAGSHSETQTDLSFPRHDWAVSMPRDAVGLIGAGFAALELQELERHASCKGQVQVLIDGVPELAFMQIEAREAPELKAMKEDDVQAEAECLRVSVAFDVFSASAQAYMKRQNDEEDEGISGESAEDDVEDTVLNTFTDALCDCDTRGSRDDVKAGLKRAYGVFVGARVASGNDRAAAIAEGKVLLKSFVEFCRS